MVSHGSDAFSNFGLLAVAALATVALAVLVVRHGWRVLFAVVPAVVAGGLALALGLPVSGALAAAAVVAALPLFLVISAARDRRGPGAQRPAAVAPVTVASQAVLQAQAPPAAARQARPMSAPVAVLAPLNAPAWQSSAAGPAIMRVHTGKGWVRAVGFGLFGLVFSAVIAGAILSNPSADADGTRLALGLALAMLVLFEGLALVCVQYARSGVVVDRAAGTVTVRRGRGLGLGMKQTVLPLSGVVAVEVVSHQRRVITPKHGLGAVIELVRYIAAPKRETVYEVFLVSSAGGPRVLVSPFAEKQASAVLPLAEQLARTVGCPLQAPSDPALVPPGLTAASPAAAGPVAV